MMGSPPQEAEVKKDVVMQQTVNTRQGAVGNRVKAIESGHLREGASEQGPSMARQSSVEKEEASDKTSHQSDGEPSNEEGESSTVNREMSEEQQEPTEKDDIVATSAVDRGSIDAGTIEEHIEQVASDRERSGLQEEQQEVDDEASGSSKEIWTTAQSRRNRNRRKRNRRKRNRTKNAQEQ